jgi:hypothetical protein
MSAAPTALGRTRIGRGSNSRTKTNRVITSESTDIKEQA